MRTLQRFSDSIYGTYQGIEEEVLSEARSRETIPNEATSVSVLLDGVMVSLRKDERPVGTNWREAACGAITFHDRTGKKLRTISSGQMPERNKLTLKCWLVDAFEPLMQERPDATYCRLEPMKDVARMVRTHLWGIINAVVLKVSNGPAESHNSRIKMIKVKSRGYRHKERFITNISFHLGGLDLYPEGTNR